MTTYNFNGAYGQQTISAGSSGDIYFNGVKLTGSAVAVNGQAGKYTVVIGDKTYVMIASGADLIVAVDNDPNNFVTIQNFSSGNFGINLTSPLPGPYEANNDQVIADNGNIREFKSSAILTNGNIVNQYDQGYGQVFVISDPLNFTGSETVFSTGMVLGAMSNVTALPNGNFIIIQRTANTTTPYQTMTINTYNSSGGDLGSPFVLSTGVYNFQHVNPSVAVIDNNKFIVTWESYLIQDSATSFYEGVFGQIISYDNYGNIAALGSEFRIDDISSSPTNVTRWSGAYYSYFSDVDSFSNGNFIATYRNEYGSYFYKIFNFNGSNNTVSEVVPETAVRDASSLKMSPIQTSTFSNNNYSLTWYEEYANSQFVMKFRLYSQDGSLIKLLDHNISEVVSLDYYRPVQVEEYPNGNILLAWANSLIGNVIEYLLMDSNGNQIGDFGEVQLPITSSSIDSISIYTRDDGSFLVSSNNIDDMSRKSVHNILITPGVSDGNLLGTDSGEVLSGAGAHDVISGLGGNDTLSGGAGADVLVGGLGNDTMTGGADNDTFVITAESGALDTITDFASGDIIDVSALGASAIGQLSIAQNGADTDVTYNGQVVKLLNTTATSLTSGSFIFADALPVAGNDTISATEDTVKIINISTLLGNDSDAEGAVTFDSIVTTTSHGTLVNNGNGTLTYTSSANYNGTDSFVYQIKDGAGQSATATATINIAAVNDAPTASNVNVSGTEDVVYTISSAALLTQSGASDVDGDSLTITSVSGATHGTVALNSGNVVFTPAANFNGNATFNFTVSDGNGGTVTRTATVNFAAVNDNPIVVNNVVNKKVDANYAFNFAIPANTFSDVDGDTLTYTATLAGGAALPSWLSFNGTNFVGTPAISDIGTITVTVTASDGNGGSVSTNFDIVVSQHIDNKVVNNGTKGNDVINGGNNNDTLNGGNGSDLIYGGDGDDIIDGGSGKYDDELHGGNGNDTIHGGDKMDTIFGDAGNDKLYGDNGDDKIYGGDGDDNIDGGVGDDEIHGGSGNDILNGGGGKFHDKIYGDDGDDKIYGGDKSDILEGGAGNDYIEGGNGTDTINGGDGNDTMIGGKGEDQFIFEGVFGNDLIKDFGYDHDVLKFHNVGGISNDNDVLSHVTYAVGYALIDLGSYGTIKLIGVTGELDSTDIEVY